MYWYPLKFISVDKDYRTKGIKVVISESNKEATKTLRTFRQYQRREAIEFGRKVAKFEKCWFRAHSENFGYIELRENYEGA